MGPLLRALHNVLIAIDYGVSMILWLHPEEPMTISSRCGLALRRPTLAPDNLILRGIGWALNSISPGHCEAAIAADAARAAAAIVRLKGIT